MPTLHAADLAMTALAAGQWGVLSVPELLGCGLTADAIYGRSRRGRLHRIHEGVYAVGHASVPLEGRFLAAVKACGPNAVLSHFSAATVWAIVEWDERQIEVTVASATCRRHPGLRVHRTRRLDRREWMVRSQIRITSLPRTLLDLAAVLPPHELRRAVRRAFARKLIALPQLAKAVAGAPRRRGVAALRRLLADGYVPTRSELEDVVLDLLDRGGIVRPDVNEPLMLEGRRVIPDFRWPRERLVLEADSEQWHGDKLARADDAERQALLEAHGERVVRVTWHQAVARPSQTLKRVLSAGAPTMSRGT